MKPKKIVSGIVIAFFICSIILMFNSYEKKVKGDVNIFKSLTLSSEEVNTPGTLMATLELGAGVKDVKNCVVTFRNEMTDILISAELSFSSGNYSGYFNITNYTSGGIYLIDAIRIISTDGKYTDYAATSLPGNISETEFYVCNKFLADTTPPDIMDMKLLTTEVKVGEEVRALATIRDNCSTTYNMVCVTFTRKGGDENFSLYLDYGKSPNGSTFELVGIPEPMYVAEGDYYISYIYICDEANNSRNYFYSEYGYTGDNKEIPKKLQDLCVHVTNPNTLDKEGPVFTDLNIETERVKAGEKAIAYIFIEDESPIVDISLVFTNKETNKSFTLYGSIGEDPTTSTGNFKVSSVVDSTLVPTGKYYIEYILITDKANNMTNYQAVDPFNNPQTNLIPDKYLNKCIYVENDSDIDITAPVLIDFKIDTLKVLSGKKATATITVKDDSEIGNAVVTLRDKDTRKELVLHMSTTTTNGSEKVIQLSGETKSDSVPIGDYYVENIYLHDTCGNTSQYVLDNAIGYVGGILLDDNYKAMCINVTDGKEVLHIPTIKSIIFEQTEINKLPNNIQVTIDAVNTADGILAVKLVYCGPGLSKEIVLTREYYDIEQQKEIVYSDGLWHGEINIDQYQISGWYGIVYLQITDNNGNKYNFMNNSNATYVLPEKLRNTGFNVVGNSMQFDMEVSGDMENLFDVIRDVDDKSFIYIGLNDKKYFGKEFFDSFRDTDKNVCVGNEQVRWFFKGEDVENESKDIDLDVTVIPLGEDSSEEADDMQEAIGDGKAMVIRFPENGELSAKCQVSITTDYSFRKYMGYEDLNIYYYNVKTGLFEEIKVNVAINSDNAITFDIEHCSDYIVTTEKINPDFVSKLPSQNQSNDSTVDSDDDETGEDTTGEKVTGNNNSANGSNGDGSKDDITDSNGKKKTSKAPVYIIIVVVIIILGGIGGGILIYRKVKSK